ncbi:MAG: hypothetical protein GC190_20565 [Alphaproteobacteria bacterium]|nr:hypothetical protein [Alphaproteobacteria bacterium]
MRVLTATIAAFFVCGGIAAANPLQDGEINPCLASADRPYSEHMIACNETIAAQTPLKTHIDARMERAKLYMSVGNWRRALADYMEVVRRDPTYAPGYAALAEARAFGGNMAGAIAEYSRAIKIEPTNASFWIRRCWMQARLGRDMPAAASDCEHGLALDPTAYAGRGVQAFIHLLQHNYQAAITEFDGELTLAATDLRARAYALYGRGIAKLSAGRDDGHADLASAQRLDPTIGDQYRTWGFSR